MASISENKAAWQTAAFANQFEVGPGPDQTSPADDEVVIKVEYVAINPSEWKMQDFAYLPLQYPHVLGSDAAGEVVRVGKQVTRFKPGDRVIGFCLGLSYGGAKHGAFQLFTTCRERVVSKVPDSLDLSRAVVLPLAISTAVIGLFEQLKLRLPNSKATSSGEVMLIWGASSSVGSVAIQLARAAGYKVFATASRRNFDFAKELGASEVFDYTDSEVVEKIKDRLKGAKLAGVYDSIGEEGTTRACAEVLSNAGGGVLPTVLWPPSDLPENVKPELIWATNPGVVDDYVAADVWTSYVPAALADGSLLAKPDPDIIQGGLTELQGALELHKKGVSAKKIVVKVV